MKKSDQIRRKTWRLLAKNLIILSVFAVVAIVGVRSWFTTVSSADAGGILVTCEKPAGLEIAITEPGQAPASGDWTSDNTVNIDSQHFSFLQNLNFSQVTGDGKTFIAPYLAQDGGIAIVDIASAWDSDKIGTEANTDYLSFDIHFRSGDSGKKVVLKSETYCGPVDPNEDFAPEGTKLNPNSVIGAVRVSSVNYTSYTGALGNRSLLWIPAPHIYYAYDTIWTADSSTTPAAARTNLVSTSNTYGLQKLSGNSLVNYYSDNNFNGTYNHNYYTYDTSTLEKTHSYIPYGTNVASNVTANTNKDYLLHKDVSISTLNYHPNGSTYYFGKCRMNVWIEGEDPEARAAQVAGEFKFNFSLGLVNA